MRNNRKILVVVFLFLVVFSVNPKGMGNNIILNNNSLEDQLENNEKEHSIKEYEAPPLPIGSIPDWELNITGIGLEEIITLNLTFLISEVNISKLHAYEETVSYNGNDQTIIGFDILQLIQNYANVWYAGEIAFVAQDDYSKSLNATEIVYSYYPPALEYADIKIVLAFAVNGSYLPDSNWANKGALRLAVPSNNQISYQKNMWVGNITEISITDYWKCSVYVDNQLELTVPIGTESSYSDIDYLTYNLTYKSKNTQFEGPSVLSILENVGIILEDIELFQAEAPDAISTIDKIELGGEKPTILTQAINGEYIGFNNGPFRLVGGNLNSWNWLKNCFALHITTRTTTELSPGFSIASTILTLLFISTVFYASKKRR